MFSRFPWGALSCCFIVLSVASAAYAASTQEQKSTSNLDPIGCVVYKTSSTTTSVTDPNNQNEVCQHGECVDYSIPDCPGCIIRICYGDTEIECESAGCAVVYEGSPIPNGDFIPCGLSHHVSLRCKGTNIPRAYACPPLECCPSCANEEDWIDYYITNWENQNWVTVDGRDFKCLCDTNPPCCP
jgi:hypothetical protein